MRGQSAGRRGWWLSSQFRIRDLVSLAIDAVELVFGEVSGFALQAREALGADRCAGAQ
jgi:hypothetical protein